VLIVLSAQGILIGFVQVYTVVRKKYTSRKNYVFARLLALFPAIELFLHLPPYLFFLDITARFTGREVRAVLCETAGYVASWNLFLPGQAEA
jgi:hypothetical protein